MTYSTSWRSPSNIALTKYWGKHGQQLPRNPSLSLTLSACHTNMRVQVNPEVAKPHLEVLYDGQPRPAFVAKIQKFFGHVANRFGWLSQASIVIDSVNTFPHGAGIASSASAMSALALCLQDIDDQIQGNVKRNPDWWKATSEVARLGSGSASRSLFPVASVWGYSESIPGSSDQFAIPWKDQVAHVFRDYQDTILMVSEGEKTVSSTEGHEFMNTLPYAPARYAEAHRNTLELIDSLRSEEGLHTFMEICESEALQLHALMMSGRRPFILMEPNTLAIIKEIWRFRHDTSTPVCFTLDAGPNVHLLYPSANKETVMYWVQRELIQYCAEGRYITDAVGTGPERLA